eukprot:Nk52_evm34s2118 gene=Nk52_evmTU34s2118
MVRESQATADLIPHRLWTLTEKVFNLCLRADLYEVDVKLVIGLRNEEAFVRIAGGTNMTKEALVIGIVDQLLGNNDRGPYRQVVHENEDFNTHLGEATKLKT